MEKRSLGQIAGVDCGAKPFAISARTESIKMIFRLYEASYAPDIKQELPRVVRFVSTPSSQLVGQVELVSLRRCSQRHERSSSGVPER